MLTNNMRISKPIHFIGLGGAGCNALEYIHQQGIKAKYTGISYPERLCLPRTIQFIPFIRESKWDMFDGSKLFTNKCRYILLAGLGGDTGTYLVEALTHQLVTRHIQFLTICSFPFSLEGNQRRITAEKVKTRFESSLSFICFDLNFLIRTWGDQTLSSAFEMADQQFYWLSQGLNFN